MNSISEKEIFRRLQLVRDTRLAYVKKYSGYDISDIRDEFIKQCNWLLENEPDFAPDTEDFGNWFDNKINEYEK